jgi:hypothetical protein
MPPLTDAGAVHEGADRHDAATAWLTEQLNGSRRVGIP